MFARKRHPLALRRRASRTDRGGFLRRRDIIIRTSEGVRHISVGPALQSLCGFAVLAVLGWAATATVLWEWQRGGVEMLPPPGVAGTAVGRETAGNADGGVQETQSKKIADSHKEFVDDVLAVQRQLALGIENLRDRYEGYVKGLSEAAGKSVSPVGAGPSEPGYGPPYQQELSRLDSDLKNVVRSSSLLGERVRQARLELARQDPSIPEGRFSGRPAPGDPDVPAHLAPGDLAAVDLTVPSQSSGDAATEANAEKKRAGETDENLEESVFARFSGLLEDNIRQSEKIIRMTGLRLHEIIDAAGGQLSGRGGGYVADEEASSEEGEERAFPNAERQLEYWDRLRLILRKMPLNAPLDYFNLSSGYGKRRDPFTGRRGVMHYGADLSSWPGSAVYATAPGRVREAGRRARYGYMVEIDHGHGIRTIYGHMRKLHVKKGQEVFYRQKIGEVGSTGRSTGPHVHYEVSFKGRPMDPMKFIAAGRFPFKDVPLAVAIPPRKPTLRPHKK